MINYVLCAAGNGSRFQKDFPGIPKPLIRLNGKSLLEWSIDSLPLFSDDNLIIVVRKEHQVKERLAEELSAKFPFIQLKWLLLENLTRGQLETAYLTKELCNPSGGIAIFNCDTYFESKTLLGLLNDPTVDGAIPCVQAEGNAWSFCKADDQDRITEVKEKQRISSWASVGFYWFRDVDEFFSVAEIALSRPVELLGTKEYYVAPLYDIYIKAGKKIVLDHVTTFYPMGSTDQLEAFWKVNIEKLRQENFRPVLVIDLDNTITIDESDVSYPDKKPNREVIKKLQDFKEAGWEIIIQTARRMQTFSNNEAKVTANIADITIKWLRKNEVPFDGLKFGKPYARHGFYVDDKAIRPNEFLQCDPHKFP